jgi:hypothetical protein
MVNTANRQGQQSSRGNFGEAEQSSKPARKARSIIPFHPIPFHQGMWFLPLEPSFANHIKHIVLPPQKIKNKQKKCVLFIVFVNV